MDSLPETSRIPHSRVSLTRSDRRAVMGVLEAGALAQGEQVVSFERAMAAYLGLRGGVAVSSGTAALHLALLVTGVGEGDEVVLPSYVCTALLHAVEYVRARPRLVDCDPATYNIDPSGVRKVLGPKTKAIIAPHLFGLPADLEELQGLGVPLIEDCAHALGSRYHGRPVGTFGELCVLSFYATKLLATGEGGMVLSNSRRVLDRIRDLREYDEHPRYRMRFNYKMTDIQAALGVSQLRRFDRALDARRRLARCYERGLRSLPLSLPSSPPDRSHIYYRYVMRVRGGMGRLQRHLDRAGVVARRPVYRPLHRYLDLTGFPGSDEAWAHALSLPLYPSLTRGEQSHIIRWVQGFYSREETVP